MPNRLGLPCTYPTLSSYPIFGQAQGHPELCLHLQEVSRTHLLSLSLLLFSFPLTLLTLLDPQEVIPSPSHHRMPAALCCCLGAPSHLPSTHHLPLSPRHPSWLFSMPLHVWNQCFHVKNSHGPSSLQMLTRDREALRSLAFACFYHSFICLLIYLTVWLPTE